MSLIGFPNKSIETIHNGLLKVKDSPYIWDVRINANNELEIFSLFQNTTVTVYDYYKDKYGNNYIYNNGLDVVDEAANTIYFMSPDYHIALDGAVLFFEGIGTPGWQVEPYFTEGNGFSTAQNYKSDFYNQKIRIMEADCTSRLITEEDIFQFNDFGGIGPDYYGEFPRTYISHLENKKIYIYQSPQVSPCPQFFMIDTDTGSADCALYFGESYVYPYTMIRLSFRREVVQKAMYITIK